jgi:hypothetical protein
MLARHDRARAAIADLEEPRHGVVLVGDGPHRTRPRPLPLALTSIDPAVVLELAGETRSRRTACSLSFANTTGKGLPSGFEDVERPGLGAFARRVVDSVSGRGLRRASRFLEELAAFERGE